MAIRDGNVVFHLSILSLVNQYHSFSLGVAFRFVPVMIGCRLSIMLGGLLSAAGLGLSMFATDLFHLYMTYGVLTGEINVIAVNS